MNGEHQPPSFAGVKMKDGKVYTYESVVDGSGEQFETGSSGKLYGKFTETVTTKKILEVKQIKALLFFKKSAGDSETYKAEVITKYHQMLKIKNPSMGKGYDDVDKMMEDLLY